MPKKPDMTNAIYNYVLDFFQKRYEDQHSNRIRRTSHEEKQYPTVESIVNMVLENDRLHESNTDTDAEFGQTSISRGTIRKAIKKLIAENKIAVYNNSYEFVPHMTNSLKQHPILDIAEKIDISIGIPRDIVVLTVAPEYTASIARYLSALFYQGDILFIPFAGYILCISVFSENSLTELDSGKSVSSPAIPLRNRLHLALHRFNCHYPDFPDDLSYDLAYHSAHNPEVIQEIEKIAKTVENDRPYASSSSLLRSIQEATNFIAMHGAPQQRAIYPNDSTCLDSENNSCPTQEEWDLMDSPIMDSVDDELVKFK